MFTNDLEGLVSVPLRGYGFEILRNVCIGSRSDMVSVPLRGYGFEIIRITPMYRVPMSPVSVPLRGYGFEIVLCV